MAKNKDKVDSSAVGQVEIARGAIAFPLVDLRVRAPDGREVFTNSDGSFHFAGLDPASRVEVFAGDTFLAAGRLDQPLAVQPVPVDPTVGRPTGALHPQDAALLVKLVGPRRAAPFLAAAATLSSIETLARGYVADGSDSDALVELLGRERPWSAKPPPRDRKAPAIATNLALTAPGALPFAGALIETTLGLSDARNRAISAFLRFAEPLARAVRTARAIADGRLAPQALLDLSEWANKVFDETDAALPDLLKEGPLPWLDSGIPPKLQGWWWLDPANQAWAQCVFGTRPTFSKPEPAPGILFSVDPKAICATAAAAGPVRLVLRASSPGGFRTLDFNEWALYIDGLPLTILNKAPDGSEVEVEVTGLRPGCHALNWVSLKGNGWWEGDAVTPACSEALRLDLPSVSMPLWFFNPRPSLGTPSLSVVAATITSFTADGSRGPSLDLEACRPTTFAWDVAAQVCAADTSLIAVSLLRDGQVLQANLPFIGSFVEPGSDQSNTYTLRVVVSDAAANNCGPPLERTITLARHQRLSLVMPPELRVGATATVRVSRSCPAPLGGAVVALQTPSGALISAPNNVTIPAGATFVDVTLNGLACGPATLTVTAPDHTPASGTICVIGLPSVRTSISPAQIIPCAGDQLRLDLRCVGPDLRVVLVAVSNSARTILSFTPAAATCVGDSIVLITIPGSLALGDYDVEVSDRAGTAVVGRVSLLPPPPSLTLTQPSTGTTLEVPFKCTNGAPLTKATIRFRAVGDRVEVTKGQGAPLTVVTRPPSFGLCDDWPGEVNVEVPCQGQSVTLVAFNSSRETSQPVNVTVQVDSRSVHSRILFRNQSGLLLRISMSIIRRNPDGSVVRTALSDQWLGHTLAAPPTQFPFPLSPCTEYSYTVRQSLGASGEPVVRDVPDGIIGGPCGGTLEVLV